MNEILVIRDVEGDMLKVHDIANDYKDDRVVSLHVKPSGSLAAAVHLTSADVDRLREALEPYGTKTSGERDALRVMDYRQGFADGFAGYDRQHGDRAKSLERMADYESGFKDGARYRTAREAAGLPVADEGTPSRTTSHQDAATIAAALMHGASPDAEDIIRLATFILKGA